MRQSSGRWALSRWLKIDLCSDCKYYLYQGGSLSDWCGKEQKYIKVAEGNIPDWCLLSTEDPRLAAVRELLAEFRDEYAKGLSTGSPAAHELGTLIRMGIIIRLEAALEAVHGSPARVGALAEPKVELEDTPAILGTEPSWRPGPR